ncbi:Resolvase-like protein [Lentisphaera araneosa HTCC2155]|uniref:Resolvase-like protein n=1 Tax=Lentisphaera araneosa HTCC2155 TaxID=313628 RepID=A6DLK1_9BACT|nr:recombinase family protein [Lentisphaera araneosa]EDM27456.1 Resolvase-like protein [Lentisphaera araneosa HTCC2155]
MEVYQYLRISTNDGRQTTKNQASEIKKYAEENGFRIDQTIEVEISSRKNNKDRRIDELLERLEKNDILVCSEISRLGRSTSEVIDIVNALIAKEVRVIFIKQNMDIKQNDIQSQVMITMFALFSSIERSLLSERVKSSLQARKEAGVVLGRPKGNSKYLPFKKRIQKLLKKGVSVRKIALTHLPELELKNPTGLHLFIKTELTS